MNKDYEDNVLRFSSIFKLIEKIEAVFKLPQDEIISEIKTLIKCKYFHDLKNSILKNAKFFTFKLF